MRDFEQTMKVLYIDYYIYIGECANAKKQFDECFELLNQSDKALHKNFIVIKRGRRRHGVVYFK